MTKRSKMRHEIDQAILEHECEVMGPGSSAEDIRDLTDRIVEIVRSSDASADRK